MKWFFILAHAGLSQPVHNTACSKQRRIFARRSPTEVAVLAASAGVSRAASSSDDASSSGAEASPVPRTMRVDGATVGGAGVAAAAAGASATGLGAGASAAGGVARTTSGVPAETGAAGAAAASGRDSGAGDRTRNSLASNSMAES